MISSMRVASSSLRQQSLASGLPVHGIGCMTCMTMVLLGNYAQTAHCDSSFLPWRDPARDRGLG
jgi:hypothetical protein